jgi:hypothetical protein
MKKVKQPIEQRIENQVMSKIMTGEVKMRPKVYFVSLTVLSILGLAVLSIVTAYSISLLALWMRIQTASGPAYGAQKNLTSLIDRFPLWAIILSILSIALIIYLVKRVGHLYRVKLSYLIMAILFIAVILGLGLSYSRFPNLISGNRQAGQGQMHGQKMK